jgi:heptosyltransferase-3
MSEFAVGSLYFSFPSIIMNTKFVEALERNMNYKAAFFCHNGLGDGVNGLSLSHNLALQGWEIDTYQNTMGSMQNWFPHLPIFSYPNLDTIPSILAKYDSIFVVQNDTDLFVKTLISEGKRLFPEKIKVLYLYPSPNIVNEPYYRDCLTNPKISFLENMGIICTQILKFPKFIRSNGFVPPSNLVQGKFSRRVVIHPTSARITRNWPKDRFVKLALHLKKQGYEVVLIPGEKDWADWQDVLPLGLYLKNFSSLDELSSFIYESKYLIGNDSGLGHLASSLGVPTLTLCRRRAWANFWAPSFSKGVVITPASWIPNISGLRLRDKYWRHFISVGKVKKGFRALCALQP